MKFKLCAFIVVVSFVFLGCEEKNNVILESQMDISTLNLEKTFAKLKKHKEKQVCSHVRFDSSAYLQCLEQATLRNPDVRNLNALANEYNKNMLYYKALDTYTTSIQKGSEEAAYALANMHIEKLHQDTKAKALFETILSYKDSTCQIGEMLALKSAFNAFSFYDQQMYKGNMKAFVCKGLLHVKRKNYRAAKRVYEKAIQKGYHEAYYYLGNLYSAYIPDIKKEIASYTKAAQANSESSAQAMFNLGMAYSRSLQRYDDAIYWYINAIENGDRQSWLGLAEVYKRLQDNQMVEKVYKTMASLNKVEGYIALGTYYQNTKNHKKAHDIFRQCIQKGYSQCEGVYTKLYSRSLKKDEQKPLFYNFNQTYSFFHLKQHS